MEKILKGILDVLDLPIVFVNASHVITFMNKASIEKYKDKGGETLVGKSIFACHNEKSKMLILDGFKKLQRGLDKVLVFENEEIKEYMFAVRDNSTLLGYFEIIEKK